MSMLLKTDLTKAKLQLDRERYAECPRCELAFLSLCTLKKHVKDRCKGYLNREDYVECDFCPAKFSRINVAIIHSQKSHQDEVFSYDKETKVNKQTSVEKVPLKTPGVDRDEKKIVIGLDKSGSKSSLTPQVRRAENSIPQSPAPNSGQRYMKFFKEDGSVVWVKLNLPSSPGSCTPSSISCQTPSAGPGASPQVLEASKIVSGSRTPLGFCTSLPKTSNPIQSRPVSLSSQAYFSGQHQPTATPSFRHPIRANPAATFVRANFSGARNSDAAANTFPREASGVAPIASKYSGPKFQAVHATQSVQNSVTRASYIYNGSYDARGERFASPTSSDGAVFNNKIPMQAMPIEIASDNYSNSAINESNESSSRPNHFTPGTGNKILQASVKQAGSSFNVKNVSLQNIQTSQKHIPIPTLPLNARIPSYHANSTPLYVPRESKHIGVLDNITDNQRLHVLSTVAGTYSPVQDETVHQNASTAINQNNVYAPVGRSGFSQPGQTDNYGETVDTFTNSDEIAEPRSEPDEDAISDPLDVTGESWVQRGVSTQQQSSVQYQHSQQTQLQHQLSQDQQAVPGPSQPAVALVHHQQSAAVHQQPAAFVFQSHQYPGQGGGGGVVQGSAGQHQTHLDVTAHQDERVLSSDVPPANETGLQSQEPRDVLKNCNVNIMGSVPQTVTKQEVSLQGIIPLRNANFQPGTSQPDSKAWNKFGNKLKIKVDESPMSLRVQRLKCEEYRVSQLELAAQQAFIKVEKMKKERAKREMEEAIKKKEEELRRREENAKKMLEEATKLIHEEENEGNKGLTSQSPESMEVTEMTTFSEDPGVVKLSLEQEPVSLTREELEALSPSERPRNPIIVDNSSIASLPGLALDESSANNSQPNCEKSFDSISTDNINLEDPSSDLTAATPRTSANSRSQSHCATTTASFQGLESNVDTDRRQSCPQLGLTELFSGSKNLELANNKGDLDSGVSIAQQDSGLPADLTVPPPNSRLKSQAEVPAEDRNRTSVTSEEVTSEGLSVSKEDAGHKTDQDEPLDLSRHVPNKTNDKAVSLMNTNTQAVKVVSNQSLTRNQNVVEPVNKDVDLAPQNDGVAVVNTANVGAESFVGGDLIIPFPELQDEKLENLLNESANGRMLILSLSEDGKTLQIPTKTNAESEKLIESNALSEKKEHTESIQEQNTASESELEGIDDIDNVTTTEKDSGKVSEADISQDTLNRIEEDLNVEEIVNFFESDEPDKCNESSVVEVEMEEPVEVNNKTFGKRKRTSSAQEQHETVKMSRSMRQENARRKMIRIRSPPREEKSIAPEKDDTEMSEKIRSKKQATKMSVERRSPKSSKDKNPGEASKNNQELNSPPQPPLDKNAGEEVIEQPAARRSSRLSTQKESCAGPKYKLMMNYSWKPNKGLCPTESGGQPTRPESGKNTASTNNRAQSEDEENEEVKVSARLRNRETKTAQKHQDKEQIPRSGGKNKITMKKMENKDDKENLDDEIMTSNSKEEIVKRKRVKTSRKNTMEKTKNSVNESIPIEKRDDKKDKSKYDSGIEREDEIVDEDESENDPEDENDNENEDGTGGDIDEAEETLETDVRPGSRQSTDGSTSVLSEIETPGNQRVTSSRSDRKRRAAARRAEKKFQAISRDQRECSDASDLSDIFSDDSEDNFDLSKEIASKKMFKVEHFSDRERLYRCIICTESFPTKSKIDNHVIREHSRELFTQELASDEDEFTERECNRSKFRKSSAEDRTVKLDPDQHFLQREIEFRSRNYFQPNETSHWLENLEDPEYTLPPDLEKYLPRAEHSTKFRLENETSDCCLCRFGSRTTDCGSASVLHTGGPAWAVSWVPQPAESTCQYLALASHSIPDHTEYGTDDVTSGGCLQIWRVNINSSLDKILDPPQLFVGIAHDHGKVWRMDWCPSGAFNEGVRLGALAVACSDSIVRIYNVKPPAVSGEKIYKAKSAIELVLGENGAENGHCLHVTWYRGKGHRYVAASFRSGLVAIWDLGTVSSLLQDQQGGLLAVQCWTAHNSSVSSVSLSCAEESEHPQYCVTGGADRYYKFWDLRDTSAPLHQVKRGMVTCVNWLPGLAAAAISHDDVYLQAHTQSLLTDSGYCRNTGAVGSVAQPIIPQNSCIWDQSLSSWLGSLAVVTSAGELLVYLLPDASKPVDHNKSSVRRRCYVYTTRLTDVTEAGRLEFCYLWDDNLSDEMKEIKRMMRYSETMPMENLVRYPIQSLNRVAWNPNPGAHVVLASGGQSGLVRVDLLSSLRSNITPEKEEERFD